MRKLFAVLVLASCFCGLASASSGQPPPAVSRITELGGSVLKNGETDAGLIYYPPGVDVERSAQQLAKELNDVQEPSGLVLIAGSEDTAAMAKLLVLAFASVEPNHLHGMTFVFVGAPQDNATVQSAMARSGAKYLFAEYMQ